jgi:hypothetical protein
MTVTIATVKTLKVAELKTGIAITHYHQNEGFQDK